VTHRKDEFAERVDEVAEQLSQAARHLARRQPGTAALLRLCGARLGSTAALIAERSPTDHLRRATRIAEAHPTLFVGGLVGGALAGVLLTRPRRTQRGSASRQRD
jgi:hypothetical protein